jgi:Bacterial extracellular solute-binding protein
VIPNRPTRRGKASRRRKRRVRTRTLVALAVAAASMLMFGLGADAIASRVSCSSDSTLINVAVSTDIAPAIQRIAQLFNREQHQAAGRCVLVQVDPASPAQAAAQIEGQHPGGGQPAIDAWIPDSSLWVDEAQRFPVGAQIVQPSGFSVATSPLMIVMPPTAAAKTTAFGKAGWRLLLPGTAGGPTVPAGTVVDLPDPSQSAAGLAALIEVSRLLGTSQAARVNFARFVYSSAVTSYFDDPASLASFVSLAAPPLNGYPVTVTSEQAVLAYDEANPGRPLAAKYPTGTVAALGSPELDYPYVLTASSRPRLAAAALFGQMLRQPYAAAVIRFANFRSASGVPDAIPPRYGLSGQLLQVAPAASSVEAPTTLAVWNKLALASRDLALIDISSAMGKPGSPGGPSFERELTETASLGLALFPDTTQMGMWEFANHLDGALPYRLVVPVGPLPGKIGPISRRLTLEKTNTEIQPNGGRAVALYGSILDGYKYMLSTYHPKFDNAELVLTSGVENAPGDITAPKLIKTLARLYDPARRVAVIIIVFGGAGNFRELQKIAAATGGQAYQITDPSQVARVFFQAVAHRLCTPRCVAP